MSNASRRTRTSFDDSLVQVPVRSSAPGAGPVHASAKWSESHASSGATEGMAPRRDQVDLAQ